MFYGSVVADVLHRIDRPKIAGHHIALRPDKILVSNAVLRRHSDSVYLREGTYHVLRAIAATSTLEDLVTPVLAALENVEPAMAVPIAADAALKAIKDSTCR